MHVGCNRRLAILAIFTALASCSRPAFATDPQLTYGIAEYKVGRYQNAYRYLDTAAAQPFATADAHYWFALVLIQLGKTSDATFELNMASRLDPSGPTGNLARERLWHLQNSADESANQPQGSNIPVTANPVTGIHQAPMTNTAAGIGPFRANVMRTQNKGGGLNDFPAMTATPGTLQRAANSRG